MAGLDIRPLGDDLGFGSRVSGVTRERLQDPEVRATLLALFEERGFILFEDVEPSSQMHVEISNVFGPLKEHPVPLVKRVDEDALPGVIDMRYDPKAAYVIEIDGKPLMAWLPWHFDHCYNNELNRAGVLRAIEIPPEGGLTGFADGIGLYQALSPDLRDRIEQANILYTLDIRYETMRFGKPASLREISINDKVIASAEHAKTLPRAVHPAVWTRKSGEKVLHVSPWMAAGIEGDETPEGDALLTAVCEEIVTKIKPYIHAWKHTDMIIWDNWRMLHSVSGHDPSLPRRMQRTTIAGDYGLGYFENNGVGDKLLEMTV
jgi:taurine dioxygenase